MAHERKAYSISYQISTHKQVFVTLSSCIGLKRNIGGSVLRAVLQNCHFRVASLSQVATASDVTDFVIHLCFSFTYFVYRGKNIHYLR